MSAFPLSLLARSGHALERMSANRRFLILVLIMAAACALVMAVMSLMLYRNDLTQHREQLQVTAQSQARLIEAVARYDQRMATAMQDQFPGLDPQAATLSQIVDSYRRFRGFRESGELTLARRQGDAIDFILLRHHRETDRFAPIPFDSELAEPMRRALNGLSGTVIGLDYRNVRVLAAHEPVAVLNLAIVAKIDLAEIRRPFIRTVALAGGLSLVVVLLGAMLFLRISNPIIVRLEEQAHDLELEILERERAEKERESLQEQFIQSQKLESVGRLAGGVAHDFNNMLGVILGYTELLLDGVENADPQAERLLEIQKAAERSAVLTRQLLAFARKEVVSPKVLELNETVGSLLKMLRRLIGEEIDLSWLPGPELGQVKMDPGQMDQLVVNLCVNARDAIDGVGKITIETDNITLDEIYCAEHLDFIPGDFVMLAVSDDGHGMSQETLQHIFEPFFTTKSADEGTGLGLAMVYGIVKQNQGFVNVYSEPDQGTVFKVYLPRCTERTHQVQTVVRRPPQKTGEETVLLVEDEETILNLGRTMLTRLGYEVLSAGSPEAAIGLAREHAGEIHLVLTDVILPEMNGLELSRELEAIRPNIKKLFMSGYTADVIAHQGVLNEGIHFIQKPFSMRTLSDKIREALEGPAQPSAQSPSDLQEPGSKD